MSFHQTENSNIHRCHLGLSYEPHHSWVRTQMMDRRVFDMEYGVPVDGSMATWSVCSFRRMEEIIGSKIACNITQVTSASWIGIEFYKGQCVSERYQI